MRLVKFREHGIGSKGGARTNERAHSRACVHGPISGKALSCQAGRSTPVVEKCPKVSHRRISESILLSHRDADSLTAHPRNPNDSGGIVALMVEQHFGGTVRDGCGEGDTSDGTSPIPWNREVGRKSVARADRMAGYRAAHKRLCGQRSREGWGSSARRSTLFCGVPRTCWCLTPVDGPQP
jgi:hypothetical protein